MEKHDFVTIADLTREKILYMITAERQGCCHLIF